MLPYTFTQQLTEREFVKLILLRVLRSKRPIVWTASGLVGALVALRQQPLLPPRTLIMGGIIGFLSLFCLMSLLVILQARKQYRSMRVIQVPITYTITESKLQTDSSGDMSEMSWGNFINRVELDSYLLLYVSNSLMIILKKPLLSLEALTFIRGKVPL